MGASHWLPRQEESLCPAALIQRQQFSIVTFHVSANMHASTILQGSRGGGMGGAEGTDGKVPCSPGVVCRLWALIVCSGHQL